MDTTRIAALLAPFLGGATASGAQLSQLAAYLDLLLRWNARMNLTAVRDPEQVVRRHFGESLFAARVLYPHTAADHLVDVGSGAGFPGLPIKVWAPQLTATLIESQYRKAIFLREAIRALSLSEVEVFAGRAEEFPVPEQPHASVTLTLRAVERFERVIPAAAALLMRSSVDARRLALLIGAAQVVSAHRLLPRFSWTDPVAIPESDARVIIIAIPA